MLKLSCDCKKTLLILPFWGRTASMSHYTRTCRRLIAKFEQNEASNMILSYSKLLNCFKIGLLGNQIYCSGKFLTNSNRHVLLIAWHVAWSTILVTYKYCFSMRVKHNKIL
jgi:hypothetical protein